MAIAETNSQTFIDDLDSPVTTPALYYLVGGTVATGLVIAFHKQLEDPLQRQMVTHQPLGSYSQIGNISGQLVPNALYVIGMESYHFIAHDKRSERLALLMLKATAYANAVGEVLKVTVREPRPYNGSVKTSFPSGHSVSIFSFAAVIGEEHPWYFAAPAYALASFVGLSRINDNQHRLHDVIAGATIGMSYGIGLANRETQRQAKSSGDGGGGDLLTIQPTPQLDGAVAVMSRTF